MHFAFRLFWGPEKPEAWIWSHTDGDNVAFGGTKADESLCIKSGHTKNNNSVHKHHLEAFRRHWGAGRQRSIAAEPTLCGEVKRCLMNRKLYLSSVTGTIQRPYCGPATDPVGPCIRRNDEKVTHTHIQSQTSPLLYSRISERLHARTATHPEIPTGETLK